MTGLHERAKVKTSEGLALAKAEEVIRTIDYALNIVRNPQSSLETKNYATAKINAAYHALVATSEPQGRMSDPEKSRELCSMITASQWRLMTIVYSDDTVGLALEFPHSPGPHYEGSNKFANVVLTRAEVELLVKHLRRSERETA